MNEGCQHQVCARCLECRHFPKRIGSVRGSNAEQLALGENIYRGQAAGGTCAGCHDADGGGSQIGANLVDATWLWSDGSPAGIRGTIEKGVAKAKQAIGAMPPLGAAPLSAADVEAITAYVWAISHLK